MSDSLKDQLLALGLASKKGALQKREKAVSRPPKTKRKQGGDTDISLDQAYRIRVKEERLEKERAVTQKRELERQRRETNRKIREIVTDCAVRDEKAEIKRNFVYKGRIRSVLATREQIEAINNGSLGVVYLSGNYHLLPLDRIEEIRAYAADHIPDLSGAENEDEKDHPVPDDLIW